MKLKVGDILMFQGGKRYSAELGARAIYKGTKTEQGEEYIQVEWIRDGKDHGQNDGGYDESQFAKVEEVSTQKEDRIFEENKEKNMKVEYDFLDGVKRVKKYLEDDLELVKDYLIEQAAMASSADHLRKLVNAFDIYERNVEQAVENLGEAQTIMDVLDLVDDTVLGGMNEVVIGLLLNIEIKAI